MRGKLLGRSVKIFTTTSKLCYQYCPQGMFQREFMRHSIQRLFCIIIISFFLFSCNDKKQDSIVIMIGIEEVINIEHVAHLLKNSCKNS